MNQHTEPNGRLQPLTQIHPAAHPGPDGAGRPKLSPRPWTLTRLAARLLWNQLRLQLTHARLRFLLLLTVAGILWFSLAAFTRSAFDLFTNTVLPPYILGHFSQFLLGALAVALGGLLAFTSGLTCYLELFRAPDAPLLLCSPLAADRIFAFKWLRTLIPGIWTLGLLVLPVLGQWYICLGTPWWSYGIIFLALSGLLVFAASLGCLLCLLVTWLIPGQSRRVLVLLGGVLVLLLAWWLGSLVPREKFAESWASWFRQLVHQLQPMQWFLAPSRWWSAALTQASQGQLAQALFFTSLLWSNALMLYLVTARFAGRIYSPCYMAIAGLGDRRRQRALSLLARWPAPVWAGSWRAICALLNKDLLTLCRDPVQWAQLGLLAAVLTVYFWTVAQFGHETLPFFLRRILHVLNLAMVALTLATWASRFVYPLVAQEIRAFWLLGLAPLSRSRVLWSKWLFTSLLGIGGALVVLTLDHFLLQLDASTAFLHTTAAFVLGLSLAAVSVGLAGLFVAPHELRPTQPFTSYGNTLTLVITIALALGITFLAGLPVFLDFQAASEPDSILQQQPQSPDRRVALLCLAQLLVGGTAAGTFFYLGQRRFRRLQW